MAAPPIMISMIAITINTVFSDINPQHTPLANGIQKQNLGSLTDYKL